MGYLFVLLSLFSYGALGICYKIAERRQCRPRLLAVMLMLSAFVGMNGLVVSSGGTYALRKQALYVAVTCGVIALCAIWAFQAGLKKGRIATSWLIINLSSVIPTLGSIVVYHEAVNLRFLGARLVGHGFGIAKVNIPHLGLGQSRTIAALSSMVDFPWRSSVPCSHCIPSIWVAVFRSRGLFPAKR